MLTTENCVNAPHVSREKTAIHIRLLFLHCCICSFTDTAVHYRV